MPYLLLFYSSAQQADRKEDMHGSHQDRRDSCAKTYGFTPWRFMFAKEKGIPVPRTGLSRKRKITSAHAGKPSGVSMGSHTLRHYYPTEMAPGSGPDVRRKVRRKERIMWMDEWIEEMDF